MRPEPISLDPQRLPDDLTLLKNLVNDLIAELKNSRADNDRLRHQITLAMRHRFGRHAETIAPNQQALFQQMIEAQLADVAKPPEAEPQEKVRVRGHGRRKPPRELPKKTEHFLLPQDKKCCPECQGAMSKIGEVSRTLIDWVAASVYVHEMVAEKFACSKCQNGVVTSEMPGAPIKRGMAGPGLLAHVVTSKFADFLPLNRQVRIFARHGFEVNDSTLNDWTGQTAYLLDPLVALMRSEVLKSKVIHSDDTPVAVLEPRPKKGQGRAATGGEWEERSAARKGRLWVYDGDPKNPYTVYDYTSDRKGERSRNFLEGWKGYLQADAYGGYDKLYELGQIVEVGCWAHTRRRFKDAMPTDKTHAQAALGFIRRLYDTEVLAHDVDAPTRRALRQQHSAPVMAKFKEWLDAQALVMLPKSPMGEAFTYAFNQWASLNRYLDDGDLGIDNNPAERALRRVAIARKNWMTLGTDEGGRWAAIFFSLIATCERHGIDSYAYLHDVIARMSTHPAERLDELLPPAWKAAREAAASAATPAIPA